MIYTPGPWEWIGKNFLQGKSGDVLSAADDGKSWGLHSAIIEHHYDEETAAANARLIAAAPDLLEALKAMLDLELRMRPPGYPPSDTVKAARAARSRAEGACHE